MSVLARIRADRPEWNTLSTPGPARWGSRAHGGVLIHHLRELFEVPGKRKQLRCFTFDALGGPQAVDGLAALSLCLGVADLQVDSRVVEG